MKKLQSVIAGMGILDWVQVALWSVTLVLLFVFVICASLAAQHSGWSQNTNAITGLLFTLSLFASVLTTTIARFLIKKREEE
ncbi:hypothetical protein MYMA111404_04125 [Mycoplasma marinum]|uniref:Uncharacterized protein n=1 Tax=Mycoplasma marinum TaxID=1937190 RepID=A0A4R0XQS3_9MOLU|nr:hypothetical protein [Mycoplasma marinum]TCG10710.1 hypothetical protein C4B24_04150 [Mycoplasma marinum]